MYAHQGPPTPGDIARLAQLEGAFLQYLSSRSAEGTATHTGPAGSESGGASRSDTFHYPQATAKVKAELRAAAPAPLPSPPPDDLNAPMQSEPSALRLSAVDEVVMNPNAEPERDLFDAALTSLLSGEGLGMDSTPA